MGAGASLLLGIVLGSSARPGAGTAVEGLFPAFGGALAMAGAIVPLPGAIGGALLAPKAWRARGPQDWFWIAVQLAILAVVLGDLLIAVPLLVGGLLTGSGAVLAFVAALVVVVFGLLVFGPFVLPFTFVAAVMWSVGMWLVVGVGRGLGVTGLRGSKVR